MTGRHYSDETLMAYADGELPSELMAEIDALVASDAAIAERVAIFAETRHLSGALPQTPVPDALRASVEEMVRRATQSAERPATRPVAANSNVPWRWRQVAAAAAVAIVAGAIGYGSARFGGAETSAIEVARSPSGEIASHLATLPSGGRVELAQSASTLEIVGTFPAGNATCREFEVIPEVGDTTIAIACLSNGAWTTTFAMAHGSAGRDFVPASGAETLESYLASIAAGPMMDDAQENAFLVNLKQH
jgi:hypothetical protein